MFFKKAKYTLEPLLAEVRKRNAMKLSIMKTQGALVWRDPPEREQTKLQLVAAAR